VRLWKPFDQFFYTVCLWFQSPAVGSPGARSALGNSSWRRPVRIFTARHTPSAPTSCFSLSRTECRPYSAPPGLIHRRPQSLPPSSISLIRFSWHYWPRGLIFQFLPLKQSCPFYCQRLLFLLQDLLPKSHFHRWSLRWRRCVPRT
jgi:hypothetical protein